MFKLKDKVVLITGGLGIQGPEHTKAFKEAGARVVVTDVVEGAEFKLDVTSEESINRAVKGVLKKYGRIDVLVNNAGATPGGQKQASAEVKDQVLGNWEHILRVNLTGVWLCSQIIGEVMVKQGKGSIINLASIYGVVGPDFRIYEESKYRGKKMGLPAAYAASKGGVISLTRYLATYWADKGVRVNSVTPGGIYDKQSEAFVNAYSRNVPLGRMAKKDEVSGAILYLASDLASYVTGENMVIDGGLTIR